MEPCIYYATPPADVAGYQWRCIVTDYIGPPFRRPPERCVMYQFRSSPEADWTGALGWAASTLPSLARIKRRYATWIESALAGETVPPEPTLFA